MSLFGSSPSERQAPDASNFNQSQSSLFEDERAMTRSGTSALFEDDSAAPSPWDMPTPRKPQSRADILRNLIPSDSVPESYIEVFDNVVRENGTGGKVNVNGVTRTLAAARLGANDQTRILQLIAPKEGEATLDRGEFNVLLALIGLAQNEEAVTLDSVDERRNGKSSHSTPCCTPNSANLGP
jgi:sorting nexin-8